MENGHKILDIGCGNVKVPSAVGLDNVDLANVDVVHDILDFPYPFDERYFDAIYLKHVIEHFSLINGYSFFPIHSFTFARNSEVEWAEPWFYDLKYGDLKLPLFIDDNKIIGFQKIEFGEETQFNSSFYYFIQTIDPMMEISAIQITSNDGSMLKYNLDDETDLYRSNFCRSINEDEIVYTFNKSPLVSNSMRYPGSIFNSEGRIYKFTEEGKGSSIMPLNRNVTLFIAILDKET